MPRHYHIPDSPASEPSLRFGTSLKGQRYRFDFYGPHGRSRCVVLRAMPDGSFSEAYLVRFSLGCNCPGYAHRSACKHNDLARSVWGLFDQLAGLYHAHGEATIWIDDLESFALAKVTTDVPPPRVLYGEVS